MQKVQRQPEAKPELALLFVPRIITVYGQTRNGWGLWVGEKMLGIADDKDALISYYHRLIGPPESNHWREANQRKRLFQQERAKHKKTRTEKN